jgi:hypothetical protein
VYGGSAAGQFSSVKENPGLAVGYAAGNTFSYSGTQDGYLVGTENW